MKSYLVKLIELLKRIFLGVFRSKLSFLILCLSLFMVYRHLTKKPNLSGTPFTEDKYEEILDKKNLTSYGVPKKAEDYILRGDDIKKQLKKVKSLSHRKTIQNALLLLEKAEQKKLENYNNPEIMDKTGKSEGDIIACYGRFLPKEAEGALDQSFSFGKRNHARFIAVLNADRYYGFKIHKSPVVTKDECQKILNKDLKNEI